MPNLPDGSDLDSIKDRLRRAGPAAWEVASHSAIRYTTDYSVDTLARDNEQRLRELGYSVAEYLRDVAALRAAYVTAARLIGEEVFETMQTLVDSIRDGYPRGGDRIGGLAVAVRDWLPFVSLCRYVPLLDDGTVLPDVADLPGMQEVPKLSPMARMHEEGPSMPTVGEVHAVMNDRFRAWRGMEFLRDDDPRTKVLAAHDGFDHYELRNTIYSQHPVILLIPGKAKPQSVENMLGLTKPERELWLEDLIAAIVTELEGTIRALRRELNGGAEIEWNRLDPLLVWAEAYLSEDEPRHSYVRVLLADIRQQLKPPTTSDKIWLASFAVAVVLTVASIGASAPALVALTAANVVVDATALAVTVHLAEKENALRDELNRFERVDAALAVAASPESTGLMLLIGLLTLGIGAVATTSAVRLAATVRRAALLSHQKSALEAGVTPVRVEAPPPRPALPPAQTPRRAPPVEPPPAPPAAAPRAEPPPAPAPARRVSHDFRDGFADDIDAATTISPRREPLELEPELEPGPRNVPSRTRRHVLDEGEAFASELDDLVDAHRLAMQMTEDQRLREEMADFVATVERTASRLDEEIALAEAAGAAGARGSRHAGTAVGDTVGEDLDELRKAIELSLGRLLRDDLRAWEALAKAARANGPQESAAFNRATTRGTARLGNRDPDAAVAREAAGAGQRQRLAERSRAGSIEASKDPRATYDPAARATNNPSELAGQRLTGATRSAVIGSRGVVQSTGQAGEPLITGGDGYVIPDFDLQTARTGGIERIHIQRAREDGGELSITWVARVLPRGIRRRNYNASDQLIGPRDVGLTGTQFHQGHGHGPGMGDESARVVLTPAVINLVVQNLYIEGWVRGMARSIDAVGGRVRLVAEAITWAPDRLAPPLRIGEFLKRITYEVEVKLPERPAARLRITVVAARPPANDVDSLVFDDSALAGLTQADLDAYRRYIFTDHISEMQEVMERGGRSGRGE